MSRLRLTDAAVKRLRSPKAGQIEYFDELLPSFGLRLSYSGARSWIVMTRVHRKLHRITLGRYPATSLEDARKEARRVIELAQKGADPRTARKTKTDRPVNFGPSTFGAVAEEFMSAYVGGRQLRSSTEREYRRILQGTDTAHLHEKPLNQITTFDVIGVLQAIRDRGSDGAAERALAYLGKFFSWCADRDYIDIPPTVRVKLDRAASSRDRVLTEEELILVWRSFAAEGGLFGALFRLLLLTGQRRGEVAGMQWSEIRSGKPNEAVWEIPA
jgi:Arm DNA-binding domain/Phage integrase central domain